jgi:hypothetical protein
MNQEAHLEEVQVVEKEMVEKEVQRKVVEMEKEPTKTTDDCPSGLYSDLPQDALIKVRQQKLQEYLEAKQRFDEVETEVRVRAWRRSLREKGDDLQARIERQRLEAEAIGRFSKDKDGVVRGAPRDSSFGRGKRRTLRVQSKPLDESTISAFLASLNMD